MIGEPTNFVHTAHVGSGDLFSGMNSVSLGPSSVCLSVRPSTPGRGSSQAQSAQPRGAQLAACRQGCDVSCHLTTRSLARLYGPMGVTSLARYQVSPAACGHSPVPEVLAGSARSELGSLPESCGPAVLRAFSFTSPPRPAVAVQGSRDETSSVCLCGSCHRGCLRTGLPVRWELRGAARLCSRLSLL